MVEVCDPTDSRAARISSEIDAGSTSKFDPEYRGAGSGSCRGSLHEFVQEHGRRWTFPAVTPVSDPGEDTCSEMLETKMPPGSPMRNPRFSFAAGEGFDVVLSASPRRDSVRTLLDLNKSELQQVQIQKVRFQKFPLQGHMSRAKRGRLRFDTSLSGAGPHQEGEEIAALFG
jgi:hypothetical protein